MTRTVILGGGFGGLTVARTLRTLISSEHEIVLLDKEPAFHVGATKTWVMLGEASAIEFERSRSELLPPGIRLIESEVTSIDARSGRVMAGEIVLDADFLVIALGTALNMNAIPGLAEAAYTFYTMEGAERLSEELRTFRGGDVVMVVPRTPIQCPPAPYEAAMLLDDTFRHRGVREKTRLSVYTVESAPMMTAGPEMGALIKENLAKRDIAFHALHKTVAVEDHRVRFENGTEVSFDLLIAVPPHEAPRIVRDAGLVGESGWIPVDPKTLRVKALSPSLPRGEGSGVRGDVFAIGDVTGIPLPGRYKAEVPLSLPKAGSLAEAQGIVVAKQIASRITGAASQEFDGRGYCYLEFGKSLAIRADGDFFAQPHPVTRATTPDEAQYRDKRNWVRRWLQPS